MIELIDSFIRPLVENGIPYIITGSVASMAYGEPRLTNDIDVVIDLAPSSIPSFRDAFPESDFYLPPTAVMEIEILRGARGHINIISNINFLKADIYFIGNDPLQKWGFANSRHFDIDGLDVSFAPPEYVIIRKLDFFREGQSQKHLRDIASMFAESADEIDLPTVTRFANERNLTAELHLALSLTNLRF